MTGSLAIGQGKGPLCTLTRAFSCLASPCLATRMISWEPLLTGLISIIGPRSAKLGPIVTLLGAPLPFPASVRISSSLCREDAGDRYGLGPRPILSDGTPVKLPTAAHEALLEQAGLLSALAHRIGSSLAIPFRLKVPDKPSSSMIIFQSLPRRSLSLSAELSAFLLRFQPHLRCKGDLRWAAACRLRPQGRVGEASKPHSKLQGMGKLVGCPPDKPLALSYASLKVCRALSHTSHELAACLSDPGFRSFCIAVLSRWLTERGATPGSLLGVPTAPPEARSAHALEVSWT